MHVRSHVSIHVHIYEVVCKIFSTDYKNRKTHHSRIGCSHPRSIFLPHVDTNSTDSSIFVTLPGSPLIPVSSTAVLCYQCGVLSASVSFLEIERQGDKSGENGGWGITAILFFTRNSLLNSEVWDGTLSWWSSRICCRQRFWRRLRTFHSVAAKRRSRTPNSQFGLLDQILCAHSPWRQRK